jgi:hypothetical protein
LGVCFFFNETDDRWYSFGAELGEYGTLFGLAEDGPSPYRRLLSQPDALKVLGVAAEKAHENAQMAEGKGTPVLHLQGAELVRAAGKLYWGQDYLSVLKQLGPPDDAYPLAPKGPPGIFYGECWDYYPVVGDRTTSRFDGPKTVSVHFSTSGKLESVFVEAKEYSHELEGGPFHCLPQEEFAKRLAQIQNRKPAGGWYAPEEP